MNQWEKMSSKNPDYSETIFFIIKNLQRTNYYRIIDVLKLLRGMLRGINFVFLIL